MKTKGISEPQSNKLGFSIFFASLLLVAGFGCNFHSASAQTTRVKIALPDFSISFLSVKVAQSQGLFKPKDWNRNLFGSAIPLR